MIVKYWQNFMKGHLHHVPKLYTMIPTQAVPDTMFTRLLYKVPKSEKEVIQSYIYKSLPKVNQVIYILDTICEPWS